MPRQLMPFRGLAVRDRNQTPEVRLGCLLSIAGVWKDHLHETSHALILWNAASQSQGFPVHRSDGHGARLQQLAPQTDVR